MRPLQQNSHLDKMNSALHTIGADSLAVQLVYLGQHEDTAQTDIVTLCNSVLVNKHALPTKSSTSVPSITSSLKSI